MKAAAFLLSLIVVIGVMKGVWGRDVSLPPSRLDWLKGQQGQTQGQLVVFQAFDWNALSDRPSLYPIIQSMAPSLGQSGITHVWFPPPSQSADQQG